MPVIGDISGSARRGRRRGWPVRSLVATFTCLAASAVLAGTSAGATGGSDIGPIERTGRWLIDQQGRVFVGHGTNVIKKLAPFVPTAFGEDDARLLADEGFTLVRLGIMWEAVEPRPGEYDDAYIDKVLAVSRQLGQYGIRTILDAHQDIWVSDGPPDWATLSPFFPAAFAAFWRDDPGPGGVGIQTRFHRMWGHLATRVAGERNIIGLDPFNEPQAGSDYVCVVFNPCPDFERGALARFYGRVISAIRAGGARQVIFPSGVPSIAIPIVSLPALGDDQTAFQYHYYCTLTQFSPARQPADALSPETAICRLLEAANIAANDDHAKALGVPAYLGEFSSSETNPDTAQVADLAGERFQSWTSWTYFPDEPGDERAEGLLEDPAQPASQANAKQDKLDALVVPHAQAIAGTPIATTYTRDTRTFTLTYAPAPVPGASLAADAVTQIFVPARAYPRGYSVQVTNGELVSEPGAPWALVRATGPGEHVQVQIRPDSAGVATQRPLDSGVFPIASFASCRASRRVVFRLPTGSRLRSVTVAGKRIDVKPQKSRVTVRLRREGVVKVVLRAQRRSGKAYTRTAVFRVCPELRGQR